MRTDVVCRVVRQVGSFVSNRLFVGEEVVECFEKSERLQQKDHAV